MRLLFFRKCQKKEHYLFESALVLSHENNWFCVVCFFFGCELNSFSSIYLTSNIKLVKQPFLILIFSCFFSLSFRLNVLVSIPCHTLHILTETQTRHTHMSTETQSYTQLSCIFTNGNRLFVNALAFVCMRIYFIFVFILLQFFFLCCLLLLL